MNFRCSTEDIGSINQRIDFKVTQLQYFKQTPTSSSTKIKGQSTMSRAVCNDGNCHNISGLEDDPVQHSMIVRVSSSATQPTVSQTMLRYTLL